MRQEHS